MNNAKRIKEKSASKKPRTPRSKKPKVDFEALPDAIFEGEFILTKGWQVYFIREREGKRELHVGTVMSVDPTKTHVTIWDDTDEQGYMIDIRQDVPPVRFMPPKGSGGSSEGG